MPEKENSVLSMWVVYHRPTDCPWGYIARRHEIHPGESRPTQDTVKADTLAGIRRQIPGGMVCIARHPDDEPQVVEVWL